ncbi:hypothetical protein MUK42_33942, partial [Musa troglodytarum]
SLFCWFDKEKRMIPIALLEGVTRWGFRGPPNLYGGGRGGGGGNGLARPSGAANPELSAEDTEGGEEVMGLDEITR